jgi:general secretion pathway protein C
MKLLSKSTIKIVILLLGTSLVVKIGWFIVALTLLNKEGVEYQKPSTSKALYYRSKFASEHTQEVKESRPIISADTIKSIKLLAIYKSQKKIIVTVSKSGKSSVLVKKEGRADSIDGYTLDGATAKEALFVRGGKQYSIGFSNSLSNKSSIISHSNRPKIPTLPTPPPSSSSGDIVNVDGITTISRGLLQKYTQNMDDIWKNIGINEKKVDGTTIGFQVNFVKRGSDFSKLGLRRGDLILAVNGDKLDSYAKALELYSSIDTIEDMTIRIKRGREEMELEYEIK